MDKGKKCKQTQYCQAFKCFFGIIACSFFFNSLYAQIIEDGDYMSAVKAHTRSNDGQPGVKYWQNNANYELNVSVNKKNTVNGHGTILYFNNAPDTLNFVRIKLYQNLHRLTSLRFAAVDSAYFTNGLQIIQLVDSENRINYLQKPERITYLHDGTVMELRLATPLLPHDTLVLDMTWSYPLNNSKTTAPRESYIDSTSMFVAYWYPRIAVYDDVQGWDESIQNETSEFYNDFSNYNIHISMPSDFTVFATGKLKDKTVKHNTTTWHYVADNVTDFAWAASDHYISDTVTVHLDKGDRTIITAYKSKRQYPKVADMAKLCTDFYSKVWPGMAFPFHNLTIFEGRSQMEYPMMINDYDEAVFTDMATVTAHEISHMYFPFFMGINETRYGWMDEGWATFFEYHFMHDGLQNQQGINTFLSFYHRLVKQVDPIVSSMPLMAPSDQLAGNAYSANSYTKGWLMYETLKNVMGDTLFKKTLLNYMQTWKNKHPTPYDFFNIFSTYSHQDLSWIFNAYAFHFGTFDLAIDQVKERDGNIEVSIKNQGGLPMPFTVELMLKNGTVEKTYSTAKTWQHSFETVVRFKVPKNTLPLSVHINTGIYPDVIPANNDYNIVAPGKKLKAHKHRG